MKVIEYLNLKGFEYEVRDRPSGQNYIMICPFCQGGEKKEKSFAINANSGLWNCLRGNNCGKSGTFFQLQEELGDKPNPIDPFVTKQKKNKQYVVPKIIKLPLSETSIKYLTETRKFTEDTISKFKLFEGLRSEIKLPFYKNGTIVNVISRLRQKKKGGIWQETNAEPVLFNRDNVKVSNDKNENLLVIVEGQYDCMALTQYGIENVTSLPNGTLALGWIENEWDFLEQFNEIYLVMDNDIAGQNAIKPLVNRLGIWRCKSVRLPYKDANECLVNNVSNEEIAHCFENAEEFTPDEIKSAGEYCKEVIDIFKNPDKYKGWDTGFPELTEILGGFRKGEVTEWSGQGFSGKSTILNQSILYSGSIGIKCCIASLELRPARYLKWAVEQTLGKNDPIEDEIIKCFEWIDSWLYILNIEGITYGSKIFELFEYTARKYGTEIFVIDSLMKVRLKGHNENMSRIQFIDDLTGFVKKFDVHCHLVAHSRKQEDDRSKPDKSAVKGVVEITDLVDNVVIMWRNPDGGKNDLEDNERYDALLIVVKGRELGKVGVIKLYFDPKSRRFSCYGQGSFFK